MSYDDLGRGLGGSGICPLHWGMQWMKDVPKCHEHCDCCSDTGCPIPEHSPDWTWGYRSWLDDFWMCPRCFEQFRELMCWHVFATIDPKDASEDTGFGELVDQYWPQRSNELIALVEQATKATHEG